MPPKKDKKKKPKAKKPKKMRLVVQEPLPKFATGFNRPIPGGLIGTGGGGGMTPASFLAGGYASRQAPPATPIVSGDQFQIQRNLTTQAVAIESIVEEQKRIRKERSDKGKKRGPQIPADMPMSETPMNIKLEMKEEPLDELPPIEQPSFIPTNIRMTKKGTPDRRFKQSGAMTMMGGGMSAPPVIGYGALFPGGGAIREQGIMMGVPSRLGGLPPDASTSLVGIEGIGDLGGGLFSPTGGLQDQGKESGV
jgi:hypothetical protein